MAGPSAAELQGDRLDCVEAEIGFLSREPEKTGPLAPAKVTIRDARPLLNEISLDREGFTLATQTAPRFDLLDTEAGRERYREEMLAFLKDYFKTSWVEPMYGPIIVRESRLPITHDVDSTEKEGVRATAGVAHLDYVPIAGPMLAALANQKRNIPIRSYSRLMIINTWRVTTPPPQDFPLALCDNNSVAQDDILVADFTEPETGVSWKNGAVYPNKDQRWYYFPNMTPDEVILFKGYDSEGNFNLAHGAFDNRAASPEAGIRTSIEARFFVYFE